MDDVPVGVPTALDALLDGCVSLSTVATFREAIRLIRSDEWPRAYVRLRRLLDPSARDPAPLARAKLVTLEQEWLRRASG
ncbi:MAG TPA: hypothetical protein VFC93_02000 [Chloroflexota bacterium]|nr:hypothetical protein [Chloroflexota bacterium]